MNTVLTKLAYHFRSFPIVGHSTKQGEELAAKELEAQERRNQREHPYTDHQ